MKIHRLKRSPLSKLNSFDQNFIKLGHIIKYYNVFFKFDNGPYHTCFLYILPFIHENSQYLMVSGL